MGGEFTSKAVSTTRGLLLYLLVAAICAFACGVHGQSNLPATEKVPKPPQYIQPLEHRLPDPHNLQSNATLQVFQPGVVPPSLLIIRPTNVLGAKLSYGGPQTNPIETNDIDHTLLLKEIEATRDELEKGDLDPHRREFLEAQLRMLTADIQLYASRQRLFKSFQSGNPSQTNLTPAIQLWENLHLAIKSKNPEQVASAKQALATLLAQRLEAVQGKRYPSNISYAEIAKEYRKQFGSHNLNKRTIILSILLLMMFVPLALFSINWLKRRGGVGSRTPA